MTEPRVQPWLKFYPADWRADPRLRMCSLPARGLWIDLISYMHEGEPYGHLTIDGVAPDLDGIASLVGRPGREVKKALDELGAKQVYGRTDAGVIFSRRMVRDKAKADRDKQNGKGGGNPKLRGEDKEGVNPPDKAQRLEARGSEAKASGAGAPSDPKADYFRRARDVLGSQQGGSLGAKLLRSFGNEDDLRAIAKARARIEDASTKSKPVEWLGRVLSGQQQETDSFRDPMAGVL